MNDWMQDSKPPMGVGNVYLWMKDGSTRTARTYDWNAAMLLYTDCTHPAQNAYVSYPDIMAWRVASPEAPR